MKLTLNPLLAFIDSHIINYPTPQNFINKKYLENILIFFAGVVPNTPEQIEEVIKKNVYLFENEQFISTIHSAGVILGSVAFFYVFSCGILYVVPAVINGSAYKSSTATIIYFLDSCNFFKGNGPDSPGAPSDIPSGFSGPSSSVDKVTNTFLEKASDAVTNNITEKASDAVINKIIEKASDAVTDKAVDGLIDHPQEVIDIVDAMVETVVEAMEDFDHQIIVDLLDSMVELISTLGT